MKSILLTQYNQQFVEEVSRLRIESLDDDFHDLTTELKEKLYQSNCQFLKNNLGKTAFISGIRLDQRMVSSVYLSLNSRAPNLMFPTGIYGEIYGVYTLPEYRHRYFAKQNMMTIIEYAKTLKGLSCLILEASEEGIHLYRELGFEFYDSNCNGMVFYFK